MGPLIHEGLKNSITNLFLFLLRYREWYTNGDYLVLLVTVVIILPLSLLRNLGKQCVSVVKLEGWLEVVTHFLRNIAQLGVKS